MTKTGYGRASNPQDHRILVRSHIFKFVTRFSHNLDLSHQLIVQDILNREMPGLRTIDEQGKKGKHPAVTNPRRGRPESEDDTQAGPLPPSISGGVTPLKKARDIPPKRHGSVATMPSVAPPQRNPSVPRNQARKVDGDDANNKLPVVEEALELAPPTRWPNLVGATRLYLGREDDDDPTRVDDAETEQPKKKINATRGLDKTKGPMTLPSFKDRFGASTVQGHKTIRLSVLPLSGVQRVDSGHVKRGHNKNDVSSGNGEDGLVMPLQRTLSFTPLRLLDIENGASILVTEPKFLPNDRFQELGEDGALVVVTARTTAPLARDDMEFFHDRGHGLQEKIRLGDLQALDSYREIGVAGRAWRSTLRRLMLASLDEVNGLRLGRLLQFFVPFLTGYESYLVGQVIEVLDQNPKKHDVDTVLKIAFENRNVSRILVQNALSRWDFIWHSYQAISNNRKFDAFGQLPLIGITSFPSTENFPATRNHVLASIGRVVLGQGGWITRVLTRNRQGLNADHPERNIAQNLAPEANGSEAANRNQFGTYVGRIRTNQFRLDHRLPVDESIVRTFISVPLSTMINNGVVHTLRQLAKHWHTLLNQPSGNFAHQRMEQLDPFETMRFHMPVVCVVLSNLRGRNRWDSTVLGPFMRKCNLLKPSITADACSSLAKEMQRDIVLNLTAGVASVYDPLYSWLDAIIQACRLIEEEATEVYQKVTSVEIGLRLGHDLITQVHWKIPSDTDLKKAILCHIQEKPLPAGIAVNERRIRSALLLTTPRDKRTLIEMVKCGHIHTEPAQLLLGRVKTLLQRDIRREALNEVIRELSVGDVVTELLPDEWYWVQEGEKKAVYIYSGKASGKDLHRFIHVDSGHEAYFTLRVKESSSTGTGTGTGTGDVASNGVKCLAYIPVAESITRAQRCYMNIELEHGKKFKYSAFMEFSYLRIALRRLAVISQIFCEELDVARLNVLREVQRSNQTQVGITDLEVGRTYYTYDNKTKSYEPFVCEKKYTPSDPEWNGLARTKILTVPPQNMIVVGGGPTGLMTVIHCTESVLTGGGVMKLFEARDAFYAGGATFERAQIVRLDARWIAMLRYYLGTGFEDVYIPASGETDAQLGNTLPTQGFVEITIKDLENMLHVEVSRMWSKGLIQCFTNSSAQYDPNTNTLTKQGQHLKIDDGIRRRVDPDGNPSSEYHSWKVVDLIYRKPLGLQDLRAGSDYGVFLRQENAVVPFKLTVVNLRSQSYTFAALKDGVADLHVTAATMPPVYPKGTRTHDEVLSVVVESKQKGNHGGYTREDLPMPVIRTQKFSIDIGHTHVVECTGKQHDSKVHLSTTTYEPYGVCCIQGLKISMGMHNFGEKRFGTGLLDDFRSTNDQNTRIIGDFTKMVRQPRIAEKMLELIQTANWQTHFLKLIETSKFPSLDELDPVMPKLLKALQWHAGNARSFKRQTLQTRFFETGDNFYLGMEFTREYDKWKNETVDDLLVSIRLKVASKEEKENLGRFRNTLMHHIDRLWYEACLEVIRLGDVYNPGARKRVPKLYIINSYSSVELRSLPVGESFRIESDQKEKYEILVKEGAKLIVRNVEGYIIEMDGRTKVLREGNLTRGPDGNSESKVALATFPVGHYVNFRTVRLNNEARGYVFAFIGDEQSTPHFMRYSGLTGACINAMLINEFVTRSLHGVPFKERLARYATETDWSNSEVVTRGTGSYYGRDGFLRPGFLYKDGIDYLHSKVVERIETGQALDDILSNDWKGKFAAALVPKGMELNEAFIRSFYAQIQSIIFNKFIDEVQKDNRVPQESLVAKLTTWKDSMTDDRSNMDSSAYWGHLRVHLHGVDGAQASANDALIDYHIQVAQATEQTVVQVVEFATKGYLYDQRIASEMFYQPKPVDTFVDDFAVEAQNLANSLVLSAAFSAGTLALGLFDVRPTTAGGGIGAIFAAILGVLNIFISFDTMTSVSRYKIRNEEARVLFFEEKLQGVLQAVFAVLPKDAQKDSPEEVNPFLVDLDRRVEKFRYHANYYGVEDPEKSGFNDAYNKLRKDFNDPSAIREFQSQLAGKFIAGVYHHNSYVQEYLVDIYKVSSRILELLEQNGDRQRHVERTEHLFRRLTAFIPRLDDSLQRGHILWGFIKRRRVLHWDFFIVVRYFWSLLWYASPRTTNPIAPIQTETLGIIRETKNLSGKYRNTVFRREIRDMEQLYWATRESDAASMIFVSTFCVHILSWIFTISRIVTAFVGENSVSNAAEWASIASTFGAILAVFHFQRKLGLLTGLWWTLGNKVRVAKTPEDVAAIRKVRTATFTQGFLTFLRLLASYGTTIALPWSVALAQFPDHVERTELPFWIALGSIGCAILATLLFFVVEYRVRYDLNPRLGEYICEAFRDEIELMYTILSKPMNDIETKQEQERETWEYVAREFLHKYRFDTVVAADRFGSILQYLQSGMASRSSKTVTSA